MKSRHNDAACCYRWTRFAKFSLIACTILVAACQDSGSTKAAIAADNTNPPPISGSTASSSSSAATSQAANAGNHAPVISGTPSQVAQTGFAYQFIPQASDADNNILAFSITNKPSWATFSTTNGSLSGTPSTAQAGTYNNIAISVSDGTASSSLATFSLQVTVSSSAPANSAPVIAGAASTAINAGQAYNFVPTATDANGDALTFSVQNKPSWASFNIATGQLSGTPSAAQVGTYSGVVISVSDGTTNVALAAFTIAVVAVSNGSATLSWTPPTENVDGSTLTNLAGYKIYYGTSAAAMNQVITINSAGITQYVVENLSPATWYFAVKTINASGTASDFSAMVSKQI